MTRLLRCQLRPGAGKNSLRKNRPFIALRRVASSRTQCLPGWNVGALPRPNLKANVFIHVIQSSRTASKWCGRRYPCPRRCSEFLPLSLRYLSLVRFPHHPGSQKTSLGLKQTRCQRMDAARKRVYRVPTVLSCRLLTTSAATSHFEPHGEARARAFGQIFGARETAVELGDELHDVEAKPEVWAMITAGA